MQKTNKKVSVVWFMMHNYIFNSFWHFLKKSLTISVEMTHCHHRIHRFMQVCVPLCIWCLSKQKIDQFDLFWTTQACTTSLKSTFQAFLNYGNGASAKRIVTVSLNKFFISTKADLLPVLSWYMDLVSPNFHDILTTSTKLLAISDYW